MFGQFAQGQGVFPRLTFIVEMPIAAQIPQKNHASHEEEDDVCPRVEGPYESSASSHLSHNAEAVSRPVNRPKRIGTVQDTGTAHYMTMWTAIWLKP
jgi:hypothetical protein